MHTVTPAANDIYGMPMSQRNAPQLLKDPKEQAFTEADGSCSAVTDHLCIS